MVLKDALTDREYDKFEDVAGLTHVRVKPNGGSVTATPGGLLNGGLHTVVELVDFEWRPIPPTALPDRNAMRIQNFSGGEMKTNYSSSIVGYVGMRVVNQGEAFWDIKDSVVLYGRSQNGTINIDVEEIS